MKLEFAEYGTFSHFIQTFYAGCVHPTPEVEAVAQAAWDAALEAAAAGRAVPAQDYSNASD